MLSLSILLMILIMSLRNSLNLNSFIFSRVVALCLIYAGVLTFNALHVQTIGSGIGIFCGLFQVTYSTLVFEIFLYVMAALVLLTWPLVLSISNHNEKNDHGVLYHGLKESRHESLLGLFSILGGSFLISSSDFLTMYLSLELQSFAVYILATVYKDRLMASTAGLKYFLLGGLSSSIILLGIALVYSITGIINFDLLFSLISVFTTLPQDSDSILAIVNANLGLYLGLALIVLGFLFKLAAAPFHNWAPDVYDGSPSNITIWLTILPKIPLVLFLIEFCGYILPFSENLTESVHLDSLGVLSLSSNMESSTFLRNIFLVSSLLSLIIGTVLGLYQTRIKRLLAFSTISHMGFILLGLAINTEQSMLAVLFYLIQYSLTTLNVFSIVLGLGYLRNALHKTDLVNPDITYIQELKGLFVTRPLLSLSLILSLFSMAGVPPLIGFFGKQLILLSAMQSGFYFMALLAIVLSVLSASYYLKIVNVLLTLEPVKSSEKNLERSKLMQNNSTTLYNSKENSLMTGQTLMFLDQINTEARITPAFAPAKLANTQTCYVRLSEIHAFIIAVLSMTIILFFIKPTLILNSALLCALTTYYL